MFVVLSLAATLSSQTGSIVGDARLEHFTEPGQFLERQVYLWDDERGVGKPTSSFFFSPAPAVLQAALGGLGAEPWVIERIIHALYLSLAAVGVIVLLREFLGRIGLAHAIAAFVYAFSPFTSQFLIPSNLFLYYALAPWLAWIALRALRDEDPWRWAAAFALAIAVVGTLNLANLAFALVPAALIAVYVALLERRGLRKLWRWTWRAGLLSALTCSAGIVVLLLSLPDVSANLRTTELPENVARTSSWFESWRGLGFWLSYPFIGGLLKSNVTSYFTEPAVVAASFAVPLGALIVLAVGRWRYRLLFGVMLFVSLVLMVGMHGVEGDSLQRSAGGSPFGALLSFAFDQSEFARGFRTPYKAGAGLMLATGALFGVGIAAVARAVRDKGDQSSPKRPRARLRRLALAGVATIAALGVVVASFPFWTGRLYPPEESFAGVPRYWDRTFEYLEGLEQPGRMLVLPAPQRVRYRWGDVHDNLFEGFSPLSPVMNSALPQATPETADLVAAIDDYVSSPGYVKGTLGPILARLGVRWVLLQNDVDWQLGAVPRPSTYDALRADPDLRLAATFGRRGKNTVLLSDRGADLLGEQYLSPVEVYEVAGTPSPRPRLAAGPPLLVAGGGDSWPALASAGMLDGPPVAYTGAAEDSVLREMVMSGSEVVVTDGNRRRTTALTIGRPNRSATLAAGEMSDRPADDLFDAPEGQSVATYADARRISASRTGDELNAPYESGARPANAFDRVERTAWKLSGAVDPTGESLMVELRKPTAVTAVSALPYGDGTRAVKAVDVIAHPEDGEPTRKRLRFGGSQRGLPVARFDAVTANAIEFRIARVVGDTGGVGITEAAVATPDGQLDLREFVRTPDDLAMRAASDHRLSSALAARPPRYELRRAAEETDLRREIIAFGNHRYKLGVTARIDGNASDTAIDSLLGARIGAAGTSRFGGDLNRRGGLVVDGDLSTGWQPESLRGPRVDVSFPATEVRSVEVLGVSRRHRAARISDIEVTIGDETRTSALPRLRRCAHKSSTEGCLEAHLVRVPPTKADHLSVTLTGLERTGGPFLRFPPKVVEVRVNGRRWIQPGGTSARKNCAPLLAVDGHPIDVRLPSNPHEVLDRKLLELAGCEPIALNSGTHRIETLPGLSGALLTASLVPRGEPRAVEGRHGSVEPGTVELVDRSPTRLRLAVDAPEGALLVGGMPWHEGWAADGGELERSAVPLDTLVAWRFEAPTAGPVTLQFQPQATYELAIALSIGAAAWCLWRVTRRPRRTP